MATDDTVAGAAPPVWLEGLKKDYHEIFIEQWPPS